METNFNLGSLKIVSAPLMDYFTQVQKNVNDNLSLMRDERKVPTNYSSIELITKIEKTLTMIGLNGLGSILLLVKDGLQSVKDVKFDTNKNIQILTLSHKILNNASFYIQSLLNGASENTTKFFKDYQDLAKTLDVNISIKDLFSPKLDFKKGYNEVIQNDLRVGIFINSNSKKSLTNQLNKVQNNVGEGLAYMLNSMETGAVLNNIEDKHKYQLFVKQVYEGFDIIQKLKISKNIYILAGLSKYFVCVISPVFNIKFADYVKSDLAHIRTNIELLIKLIDTLKESVDNMDEGEKTGSIKADDKVVKEIVFELVKITNLNSKLKEMPVVKELEQYFDLDAYSGQLMSENMNVEESISEEKIQKIDRYFLDLKEEFTLLETKKNGGSDALNPLIQKIMATALKLKEEIVGFEELEKLILSFIDGIKFSKTNVEVFSSLVEKEVSLALVLLEYGLNTFVKNNANKNDREDFAKELTLQKNRVNMAISGNAKELAKMNMPTLDDASKRSDEQKTFMKLFKQVSLDLNKSEEVLDYFLRNNGENAADLETIFKPLSNMVGIFSVIGKEDIGAIVKDIQQTWQGVNKNGKDSVSEDLLSNSITFLSGLSLFVNALKSGNDVDAEEVYDNLVRQYNKEKGIVLDNFEEMTSQVVKGDIAETVEVKVVEPKLELKIEESKEEVVKNIVVEKPEAKKESIFEKRVESTSNVFKETTNNPDLAEVFLEEATEVLSNLTIELDSLQKDTSNKEVLTNVRRLFHTLKGSGRMVGLDYMGEVGWMVEQTLNRALGGELPFTPKLFDEVVSMKESFDNWVKVLQSGQEVIVDLVSIKKIFLEINTNLSNHVDIPLDVETQNLSDKQVQEVSDVEENVEETVQEEVEEEIVVEDNKTTINIEGHEISTELLDLFNEESLNHIENLKIAVNDSDRVALNKDFIRHAHTLNSISKSVNMFKLASFAELLEDISNMVMDKDLIVAGNDFLLLREVILLMEVIRNSEKIDDVIYERTLNNLDGLKAKVTDIVAKYENQATNDEIKTAEPKEEDNKQLLEEFDMNKLSEMLEGFNQNIAQMVELNMKEVKKDINQLQEQVNAANQPGNGGALELNSLLAKLNSSLDEKNKVIADAIAREEKRNQLMFEGLQNKIQHLEETVNAIKTGQEILAKVDKENTDAIRKDLRIVAHRLQDFFSQGVFGKLFGVKKKQ